MKFNPEITGNRSIDEADSADAAEPIGPVDILRASTGDRVVYYALQRFRSRVINGDYFAVRLQLLGESTWSYIGNHRALERAEIPTCADFGSKINAFEAHINKVSKRISFGPSLSMMLSPSTHRGLGLGSYAISQLFELLNEEYSDYAISRGPLMAVDGNAENRGRREAFLRRHGFAFSYNGTEGDGYFYANKVANLQYHYDPTRVDVISLHDLLTEVFQGQSDCAALYEQIEDLKEKIAEKELQPSEDEGPQEYRFTKHRLALIVGCAMIVPLLVASAVAFVVS